MKRGVTTGLVLGGFVAWVACGREAGPAVGEPAEPPARVDHPTAEAELATLHLTAEAVAHLGVETTTIETTMAPSMRAVVGFVTIPPGRSSVIVAPVAGTLRAGASPLPLPGARVEAGQVLLRLVPLAPVDRDVRAQARRQSAITHARLGVAKARVDRLTKLIDSRAASQRTLEEATGELETAKAEDQAAQARERALRRSPLSSDMILELPAPQAGILRTLSAMPGQSVAAGASLLELMPAEGLWVRVPVYAGDLERIAIDVPAGVLRLGAGTMEAIPVSPVVAPPSADPLGASIDLYYVLPESAGFGRPGERVMVQLPHRQPRDLRVLPASAVVLDFDGGAWVYECLGGDAFRRRRVEVYEHAGSKVSLTRGPRPGTCVVSVGAMELLGAELGVKH